MATPQDSRIADEEIKAAIANELSWDSQVDASDISVHVNAGFVTLTGTVHSYGSLKAAESDALNVFGVVEVENQLTVQFPGSLPVPGDATIQKNIEIKLDVNPDIASFNIHVAVTAGVVMLTGTVPNHWEKHEAAVIAASVHGVIAVENDLAVVPTAVVSDEIIAEQIVGALMRNALIDVDAVDVTVSRGSVILQGKVQTTAARMAAYRAASHTAGVLNVQDRLVVQP